MSYQFNPLTGTFDIVNPRLTGSEIKALYEDVDDTNAFTDEKKSKVDNSVQLDGNQTVTGIKTFTEKLLLPNCLLINNVAHFNQTTNPTQRVFLVNDVVTTEPLVVGDKNYRTDLQINTFWNGMYWLGEQQERITPSAEQWMNATGWAVAGGSPLHGSLSQNVYIHSIGVAIGYFSPIVSGDWSVQFGRYATLFSPTVEIDLDPSDAYFEGGYRYFSNSIIINRAFLNWSLNRLDAYYVKNNPSANSILHRGLFYRYSNIL